MYDVTIVGATGLVGKEFLSILESRNFPVKTLTLFASERSEGETLRFKGKDIPVNKTSEENIRKNHCDFAFFSAGAVVSKQFAEVFSERGTTVIDNSSAFRMEKNIPLVVPEVNGKPFATERSPGIIANPNCSTIQMIPVLKMTDELFGLKSLVVSTYQSVSGSGMKGIDELSRQTSELFKGRGATPSTFPQRISFNTIPQIGPFYPDGYTSEERKMIEETRKILSMPDLPVDVTAVRVPVFYGHGETLTVFTEKDAAIDLFRKKLKGTPPLELMDDIENLEYPTPADAAGRDSIFVGRIRHGNGGQNKKSMNMWITADNVRIGAALNAIKIAEQFTEKQT